MSREFTDVLRDLNGGKFTAELTEQLAELVASAVATGKKASISVKLTLLPGKGASKVITIEHDFTVKSPEFERPADYMFVGPGGSLVRDNPDQQKLDLRDVKAPVREVVDTTTGEIKKLEGVGAGG